MLVNEIQSGYRMPMEHDPGRRRPAHFPVTEVHNRTDLIFLTVCTKERRPVLASPHAHALLCDWWRKAEQWTVGRYVILPDHIHLFCAPHTRTPTALRNWVAFWKNGVSRNWPEPGSAPLWQRDFWDTQIRIGDAYGAKWEYVRNNPVRHGLVSTADEWPYQGELATITW